MPAENDTVDLSAGFVRQVVQTVLAEMRREKNVLKRDTVVTNPNEKGMVKLQEDLDSSTDELENLTDLASATAKYIKWNSTAPDSDRSLSEEEITVYNPSEDASFPSGKLGTIEMIGGIPCFIPLYPSGGGNFGSGIPVAGGVDCAAGTIKVDVKTWGAGCVSNVPEDGVDSTDLRILVEDPCDRMAGHTEADIESASSIEFWYENVLDGCTTRYRLLGICGVDSCA